jgi:hypothetical protein
LDEAARLRQGSQGSQGRRVLRADPLFRRNGRAAVLIKITGTRSKPVLSGWMRAECSEKRSRRPVSLK